MKINEFSDIIKLLESKNEKYGNSWRELGILGMSYRIKDKSNRLINMIMNYDNIGISDEEIEEEVNDILGYAILMKKNLNENGRLW